MQGVLGLSSAAIVKLFECVNVHTTGTCQQMDKQMHAKIDFTKLS